MRRAVRGTDVQVTAQESPRGEEQRRKGCEIVRRHGYGAGMRLLCLKLLAEYLVVMASTVKKCTCEKLYDQQVTP